MTGTISRRVNPLVGYHVWHALVLESMPHTVSNEPEKSKSLGS